MTDTRLTGPAPRIDRLDPHDLEKPRHPLAIDPLTFSPQQHDQAPASVNGVLQMQLVQAPHQQEILLRLGTRLVVKAAPGDAQNFALLPDAGSRAWAHEFAQLFYRPNCLDFFKPIQIHRQLADLLMQLGDGPLAVSVGWRRRFKQLRQPIPNDSLPLRDQGGMHLILAGDLPDGFNTHQRFQTNFGLERSTVMFAFCFHCSALSHIEQKPESQA
jgi:hypothetical protein